MDKVIGNVAPVVLMSDGIEEKRGNLPQQMQRQGQGEQREQAEFAPCRWLTGKTRTGIARPGNPG